MADLVTSLGLLEKFSVIFPFLLILVMVYAILSTTQVLGKNSGVQAMVALSIALIALFSSTTRAIINIMAPWFVVFFIFLIFVIMAAKIFGDIDMVAFLSTNSGRQVGYWIVAISLIIFLGSIAAVVFSGGIGLPTDQAAETLAEGEVGATGSGAFWSTLVHPNVLGTAFLLLVGMFTVQRLAAWS